MQIAKKILLLGAGHANIQVLHQLALLDQSHIEVILISDVTNSPYSGMIPSYMAGIYEAQQLHFDLLKICLQYKFNFIVQKVEKIEARKNRVQLSDGSLIDYDICSINIGIEPRTIPNEADSQTDIIYLKPISKLIQKWDELIERSNKSNENTDFTVIGGGAAAFEIAIACRRRFPDLNHKIQMITGDHPLLFSQNMSTRKLAYKNLKRLQIDLIENVRVIKINEYDVELSDGQKIPRKVCLIGTSAQASPIFQLSHLPVNQDGFVRVDRNLRIEGFQNIFAAGDCCDFLLRSLPKAGVFAVREGPILFSNIKALIDRSSFLIDYKPQKDFLTIMVSGHKRAIFSYRGFAFEGKFAWWIKNFIDLKFMKRFQ